MRRKGGSGSSLRSFWQCRVLTRSGYRDGAISKARKSQMAGSRSFLIRGITTCQEAEPFDASHTFGVWVLSRIETRPRSSLSGVQYIISYVLVLPIDHFKFRSLHSLDRRLKQRSPTIPPHTQTNSDVSLLCLCLCYYLEIFGNKAPVSSQ